MNQTRRSFLQACMLVSGVAVFPITISRALASQEAAAQDYEVNDWVKVGPDGRITLGLSQIEVGQGVYTGLPQILADELDADWEKISVEFVTGRDAYRFEAAGVGFQQFVGGSTSTFIFYDRLRKAGAFARESFKHAAHLKHGWNLQDLKTSNGQVTDEKSGQSIAYGSLVEYLPKVNVPEEVALKEASASTLIGRDLKRLDTADKVNGRAVYGIDVKVPGMLVGAIRMAPTLTGAVAAIKNAAAIEAMPGIKGVVNSGNAVIVVADSYWQAKKACDLLDVEWEAKNSDTNTPAIMEQLTEALAPTTVAVEVKKWGDVTEPDSWSDGTSIEAEYYSPYIAHATMEPMVATVEVRDGEIEVWGPVQGQDMVRWALGKRFELPPEKIVVHTTFAGGSFGRKYVPDFVVHAAVASSKVGAPVKVIRNREDDMRHGFYRPNAMGRLSAQLNPDGTIKQLRARVVGHSLYYGIDKKKFEKWGYDPTMADGIYNSAYQIPAALVECVNVPQPIPVSFMRTVGLTSSIFMFESFINETARAGNIDPVAFRRNMLKDDEASLRVLDETARKFNWDQELPKGLHKGFGFYQYIARGEIYTTYVALAVLLQKDDDGSLHLKKIVCGVDCGRPINKNLIRSTIEGSMGFALTNTFHSNITLKDGAVEQGNFDTYNLIRIAQMPEIESVIIDSTRPPQGVGEMVLPPLAPAIADAIFSATGVRHRNLPLDAKLGDRRSAEV